MLDPPVGSPPSADGPSSHKSREHFRNYEEPARASVRELYRLNHRHQTYDFGEVKRKEYLGLNRRAMGVWEALEYLNTLVDDSDPDTELSQIEHLLQTAEAIRADGHPDWFVLTGLDPRPRQGPLPVRRAAMGRGGRHVPGGLRLPRRDRVPRVLRRQPRRAGDAITRRACGIYEAGCGLANVRLSWGHDEYMYHVVKDYLPEPKRST